MATAFLFAGLQIVMLTPARAAIMEDADGQLVIIPAAPVPGDVGMSPKQMLGECTAAAMGDPNARSFTPDEFASGITTALRTVRWIQAGIIKPDDDISSAESAREIANGLEECRMKQNAKHSGNIAMLSCDAMFDEMWKIDTEAELLFKKGAIYRPEWVHALEQLLPAAQMCRSQLGTCYNPAKPTQKHVVDVLRSFALLLSAASNNQTNIHFNLPACTPTYMPEDEIPDPYKMQLIEYLNTTVNDEFTSVGGVVRPPPKVEVKGSEP